MCLKEEMETEGPPSDTAGSAEEADEPGSSGTEEEAVCVCRVARAQLQLVVANQTLTQNRLLRFSCPT